MIKITPRINFIILINGKFSKIIKSCGIIFSSIMYAVINRNTTKKIFLIGEESPEFFIFNS